MDIKILLDAKYWLRELYINGPGVGGKEPSGNPMNLELQYSDFARR